MKYVLAVHLRDEGGHLKEIHFCRRSASGAVCWLPIARLHEQTVFNSLAEVVEAMKFIPAYYKDEDVMAISAITQV